MGGALRERSQSVLNVNVLGLARTQDIGYRGDLERRPHNEQQVDFGAVFEQRFLKRIRELLPKEGNVWLRTTPPDSAIRTPAVHRARTFMIPGG